MYEIKIPKELKVGGHDYTIDTSDARDKDLEDRQVRGEHSDTLREIRVRSRLSPQEMSSTFIHEFCHAVNSVYCGNGLNELDVRNISAGIHQILEELGVRFVK